jgi:DNA-binding XRE family transcriptional regulator
MKRIQCTKCKQVFWVELQVDGALVENGEWIQIPCPRCGSDWGMVQSGKRLPKGARKRRVKPPIRPKQAGRPPGEKALTLSPAKILSFRKKLGLTQTELASLAGVDRGSVLSWEKGKFKPKAEKAAQLAALATKGKEEVGRLLGEKTAPKEGKPNRNRPKKRGRGSSKEATKPPKK